MPATSASPGDRARTSLNVTQVLSRNAAWNYTAVAVNIVVSFVLFRYVVSRIGDAAGGIWLLMTAVNNYFGLFQLGIAPAAGPMLAGHLERRDLPAIRRLASTTVALLTGLGVLPVLLLPAAPRIVAMLNVPPQLQHDAVLVFMLGFVAVALQTPGQAFNAFLSGAQRQDRCAQTWMASLLFRIIGASVALESGFGVVGLAAMEVANALATDTILAVLSFRSISDLHLSWSDVNTTDLRHVMSFGGILFVIAVCSLLIEQTDRIVIGAFLPVAMVTYYAASWKLYMLVYLAPTTLLYALPPLSGALAGRSEFEELRRVTLRMAKYSAGLAVPLIGLMIAGAPAILMLWLGPAFASHAAVAQILLIGCAVTVFNHAVMSALIGMRRVSGVVWANAVPQAVVNVGLSVWLVRRFGIMGVALGTVIPAVALEPLFLRIALRELGVTWTRWVAEVVRPVVVPAVCFIPAAAVSLMADRSPVVALIAGAGAAAAYTIVFVKSSLSPEERWSLGALLIRRRWSGQHPAAEAIQSEALE